MKVLKIMFYIFVIQNVLSVRIHGEKIIYSTFLAVLNILNINVTPLFSLYNILNTEFSMNFLAPEKNTGISSFMHLVMTFLHVINPFMLTILSFMNFKKRVTVYKLIITCIRVHENENINFRAPIRKCFSILILLIFISFYQMGQFYVNNYERTWMGLFTMLLILLTFYFPYYVIFLGIFYFMFVTHLLDHTILNSEKLININSVDNRLILINELMKKFMFACGPQVSFTFVWILSMLIVNVSYIQWIQKLLILYKYYLKKLFQSFLTVASLFGLTSFVASTDSILGILVELFIVFLFAHSCHQLSEKSGWCVVFFKINGSFFSKYLIDFTDNILSKIGMITTNFHKISNFLDEIDSFDVHFKLFNIFVFNYEFLYILLSSCLSYAIIMVQFEIEASKHWKVQLLPTLLQLYLQKMKLILL